MATTAFLAGAESGVSKITRVDSWEAFGTTFDSTKLLHVSLRAYFENDGSPCQIVPVSELAKLPRETILLVAAGQDIASQVTKVCTPETLVFGLLNGPQTEITDKDVATLPSTSRAASFYPWLTASWTKLSIPPSAIAAALLTKLDKHTGVWKSPASTPVKGDLQPIFAVSETSQRQYQSGKAVNMLRSMKTPGRPHHGIAYTRC